MARSTVTPQSTNAETGIASLTTEAANVDGNAVMNNGRRIAVITNGDASSHTVTQVTGGEVRGLAIADPQVAIAAGDTAVLGPWPSVYNQSGANAGQVWLDYDAVTSVTIAVVEI